MIEPTFSVIHEEHQVGQIFNKFGQMVEICGIFGNAPHEIRQIHVLNLQAN